MSRNLIRDGYTRQGYIAAKPGLHDDLSFTYRLMLTEEVEEIDVQINTLQPKVYIANAAAAMVQRLVSWSECNADGSPVPISADAVRCLPLPLFMRLLNIIQGRVAPDNPTDELSAAHRLALQEGTTVGEVLRRQDEKNS